MAPPIRTCWLTVAPSCRNAVVPPMRGPPPQTLSHETLIVPCPSPASNQNPSRRWSDWPHAGGATSHSAPDAAKTTTVVCTEPLRACALCKLRTDVRRHKGVLRHRGAGMRLGLRSEEHTSELQSRLHLVC